MNAIASRPDFTGCPASPPPPHQTPRKRIGILRRLHDAVMLSCQRRAERDVARLLVQSGGRLTDDIERRMTEQLIRRGSYWP
jgi:hypothetical protein